MLTVSVFTATACTSQTGEGSSAADSQSVSQSQENSDSSSESEADSSQTAKPVTDYTTYVSNTVISTGNNFYIEEAENITYRAYLPVEEYGELEYKFFFTNTVDSTYTKGKSLLSVKAEAATPYLTLPLQTAEQALKMK